MVPAGRLPPVRIRLVAPALAAAVLAACGGDSASGPTGPVATRPVPWTENSWTQPVPAWGSPVRLNLPVPLSSILLSGGFNGLGAFGAHEGGHVEGLNHVWIPTTVTTVRSWAAGKVTKIEDMGSRGTSDGRHEYFITIDYGQGLVGKHLDTDRPLVKVGDVVKEGDPVATETNSAEFNLIDNNRSDGERTGGSFGSPVSPFDYLRDDVKAALVARYTAEVVEPYFRTGQSAGVQRPWEPFLTNKMLFHADHKGTVAGEWICTNKGWSVVDPVYYDVMTIFDVTNSYGHFQRVELMDHDWSIPGNKNNTDGVWQFGDAPGRIMFTLNNRGPTYYGLFAIDESTGRAKLTIEWKLGSYPAALSPNAAIYVERAPIYLGGDALALGIIR